MDRPGLSPQRRFHPRLSFVITSMLTGAKRRTDSSRHWLIGGMRCRERVAGCQRRREDMPDIEQADLPGFGNREHPAPEKSYRVRSEAAASLA